MLIIGHVAGLFQTTPQIKPGDEKYKVPNLVGMTLKQAEDACEEAGLVLSIVREEESEQYEKDYIFIIISSAYFISVANNVGKF